MENSENRENIGEIEGRGAAGSTLIPLLGAIRAAKLGSAMARYSAFLGRWVEVHYRAGDILLPASGTFVADSGKSIFLEQHLEQRGQNRQFRWEIPYQYIVRLEEPGKPETVLTPNTEGPKTPIPLAPRKRVPLN